MQHAGWKEQEPPGCTNTTPSPANHEYFSKVKGVSGGPSLLSRGFSAREGANKLTRPGFHSKPISGALTGLEILDAR